MSEQEEQGREKAADEAKSSEQGQGAPEGQQQDESGKGQGETTSETNN